MNNFQKITEMTEDELAEFINNLMRDNLEGTEPLKWFDKKYCKKCPDVEVEYNGKKEMWKECYFDGKCLHQDWGVELIKLWLDGEIEDTSVCCDECKHLRISNEGNMTCPYERACDIEEYSDYKPKEYRPYFEMISGIKLN